MGILITTNRISPLLGAVISELKTIGLTPTVHYQQEDSFLGPSVTRPPWMNHNDSLIRARLKNLHKEESDPEIVIALGMNSAAEAIREFPRAKLITIMVPGDLDFSRRNRAKMVNFVQVNRASAAFIFIDEWEMTKAVSLDSSTPHFLWNPAVQSGVDVLESEGEKVAVVYDGSKHSKEELEETPTLDAFRNAVQELGKKVHFIESNSLFWYSDLKLGRVFENVIRLRFKECSHAVFLDDDIDSIVSYLRMESKPGKVIVRASISSSLVSRDKHNLDVSSTDTWHDRLLGNQDRVSACPKSQVVPGRSLVEILDRLIEGEEIPDFFEDFGDFDSFGIFLTVAAVENRSDGARPQRIRNMYLALSRSIPTVQLNFDQSILSRRLKLIEFWLEDGLRCDIVYGENSTNPVQSVDSIVQAYRLLDRLAAVDATPSCWFVRDLHWLDQSVVTDEAAARVKHAGAFELERLSRSFGSVVSPSLESAELFNELIDGQINAEFQPLELPPAVTRENCVLLRGSNPGTTFLYTGGIGEAYKMDMYLDAIAQLLSDEPSLAQQGLSFNELDELSFEDSSVSVYFDFLVRPSEQAKLEQELGERGIFGHPSIRILNGSLDQYQPITESIVGILLLESPYASRALPYKSVSYAEKGIRFLAYEGSPAQRVFGPRGIVESVRLDREELAATLSSIISGVKPVDINWQEAWSEEDWDSRIQTMREIATVASRES